MDSKIFCVYNLARGVFLSSNVKIALEAHQPLKMLTVMVNGFALQGDAGLWLTPLLGTPAVPRLFPFDLVYLDSDHRILNAAELVPGVELPPYHTGISSALVLPLHTIQKNHTAVGDRLIVCVQAEMDRLLEAIGAEEGKEGGGGEGIPVGARRSAGAAPVAPAAAFSWIKFAGQTATPPEKAAQPAEKDTQIAKSIEKRPVNGLPKVKSTMASEEPALDRAQESKSQRLSNDGKLPKSPAQGKNGSKLAEKDAAQHSASDNAKPPIPPSVSKQAPPNIAIAEVVLERPKESVSQRATPTEDAPDLFANWVVSPSSAPEWIEQKVDPFIRRPERPTQSQQNQREPSTPSPGPGKRAGATDAGTGARSESRVDFGEPGSNQPKIPGTAVKHELEKAGLHSEQPATPTSATGSQPADTHTGDPKDSALKNPVPRIAIRPASQTTSFTVAQYGMWHVSAPTAIPPAAPLKDASPQLKTYGSATTAAIEKQEGKDTGPEVDRPVLEATAVEEDAATQAASIREALRTISSVARPAQQQISSEIASELRRAETPAATSPALKADRTQNAELVTPAPQFRSELREQAPHQVTQPASPPPQTRSISAGAVAQMAAPSAPAPTSKQTPSRRRERGILGRLPRILKADTDGTNLATRFKRWFNPASLPSDRRRANRRYVPGMVAHYYTGGAPIPHEVADISLSGFYILTEDSWMPDTMIQMTLQKPCGNDGRKQSVTVLSRVVRRGSDGVAAEFVMPESLEHYGHDVHPSQTTDKFALVRFL